MGTVFLICGNTGAGKTTYSIALTKKEHAIAFSIDFWMQTLYGVDYDSNIHDFNWILERTERCKVQMLQIAEQLIKQGVNVIFEFGCGYYESRKFYREWASALGANAFLYFLDVPEEERRKRVYKRNSEQGPTFSFKVTDSMFDFAEPMFEPPTEDELMNGMRVEYYTNP